jgi:hypothetical protein
MLRRQNVPQAYFRFAWLLRARGYGRWHGHFGRGEM